MAHQEKILAAFLEDPSPDPNDGGRLTAFSSDLSFREFYTFFRLLQTPAHKKENKYICKSDQCFG